MEELEKIKQYIAERGNVVSVPQIQKDLGYTYRQARAVVEKLVESDFLQQKDDINFVAVFKTAEPKRVAKPSNRRRTSGINRLIEHYGISKVEQDRVNRECYSEKFAEFLASSKKASGKKKIVCKQDGSAYACMVGEFNDLSAEAQNILQESMSDNPKISRFDLYQLLREESVDYPKFSNTFMNYDMVLCFLLRASDNAFEKFRRQLKI